MFDVGFSEMLVIAIVALVVIGPERLPKVARTAGHLLGRLQRYVSNVKADIHREMQLEELRKLQSEIQESARSVEQSLTTEIEAARQAVQQTAQAVGEGLTPDLAQEPPTAPRLPTATAATSVAAAASDGTAVDQPTRPT